MTSPHVYSLDEFRAKYELDPEKGQRLFKISGPAKADLDTFMAAYQRRRTVETDLLNVRSPASGR
jgi:hypothetical protein